MQRSTATEESGLSPLLLSMTVLLLLFSLSIVIGLLSARGWELRTLALLAAPVLLLSFLFATRHSQALVLGLPLAALLLPRLQLRVGRVSEVHYSMLLACLLSALWFSSVLVRRRKLSPSALNRPSLIFMIICIISLGWGIVWRDPFLITWPRFIIVQVGALVTIVMSPAAALLVGNFVNSERQLKYIFGAFIIAGVLMTLSQTLQIQQTVLNDGGLWGMWTAVPLCALLIAQPRVRWYWRLLLLILILLNLYQTVVINRNWLSGWVPTIVALAALVFIRSPKNFLLLLPLCFLLIVVNLGFFRIVAEANIDDGSLERLVLWEQNWRIVKEHWLLGTGPAGYAIYYMSYFPVDARSTHNNYLDIVAQFGFLGLAVWFWLAFAGLHEGWRLCRSLPPGFSRTLAMTVTAGWIGACASMFFGDWILPFAYNQGITGYKYTVYSWIFLGTLIVLRRLNNPSLRTPDEAASPVTPST